METNLMDAKICTKCTILKWDDKFPKRPSTPDGYHSQCKACKSKSGLTRCKRSRLKLKLEITNHYGGKCSCCSESEPEFLVLDHINGDGRKHRREHNILGGGQTYLWIKRNNFPDTFQVLCANCNTSKGTKKECIHKRKLS